VPPGAPDPLRYDVVVTGAGIAGLTTSVYLREAGLRVVCLDLQGYPHSKVGESLDWSSPWFLETLGISRRTLLGDQIATLKDKIAVFEPGADVWTAMPPPGIVRSPLRFETVTLHVDRTALDQRVYERAVALGVDFIWERVSRVDRDGDRLTAVVTSGGHRVEGRWYIDATGTARLLARAFDIAVVEYGRRKVCFWTYLDGAPLDTGTTFFLDSRQPYLSWVWDIPISPRRTSVGLVVPADCVQAYRRRGLSNKDILANALAPYERFAMPMASQPDFEVQATSFQPYVTSRVCGPNWMMVGEAASMPDPLTGNGVTSGMRHARYARTAIVRAGSRPELAAADRRWFSRHVHRLGHSFNSHIERVIYQPPVRRGLGMRAATIIYTLFAFFMNALYTRFDPTGPVAMAIFDGLFVVARVWVAMWLAVGRIASWRTAAANGDIAAAQ
jgi:flavin-dependent dehydrogenase